MSNKVKFTPDQKMFFVLKFKELKISLSAFCRLYNVERTAIHRWSIKYDNEGLKGLEEIKNIQHILLFIQLYLLMLSIFL